MVQRATHERRGQASPLQPDGQAGFREKGEKRRVLRTDSGQSPAKIFFFVVLEITFNYVHGDYRGKKSCEWIPYSLSSAVIIM